MNIEESIAEAKYSLSPELQRAVSDILARLPKDLHIFLLRSMFNTPEQKADERAAAKEATSGSVEEGKVLQFTMAHTLAEIRRYYVKEMAANFALLELKLKHSYNYNHVVTLPSFIQYKKYVEGLQK